VVVGEMKHNGTIRLGRGAVQRAGACVGRKPLSRKGRALPAASFGRRPPGWNGSTARARAENSSAPG